jgi:hypothetical protein
MCCSPLLLVDIFDGRPNAACGFPEGFLSTAEHFERIGRLPRRETINANDVGIIGFTISNISKQDGSNLMQFNYQFFVFLGNLL